MSLSKYARMVEEVPKPRFDLKEIHLLDEETHKNDKYELKLSVQEMMVHSSNSNTMVPKEVYINIRLYKNTFHQCGVSFTPSVALWAFQAMSFKRESKANHEDGYVQVIYHDNGYEMVVVKNEKKSSITIDKSVVAKIEELVKEGFFDRVYSLCDADGIEIIKFP